MLRRLVTGVNIGWAAWALLGGLYFLMSHEALGERTAWKVFDKVMYGYEILGISLLACGVVSLWGVCFRPFARFAALLCAVWCGTTAVVLQFARPGFDQGDIDAWLLLMCAFTCVMRWALLKLEPHLGR